MKTSSNSLSPVICRNGRHSTPGECMSTTKNEMPRCFGTSGSVRAMRMAQSEKCPPLHQTFWPLTTHSSPSRTADVVREARSDPASGSENS